MYPTSVGIIMSKRQYTQVQSLLPEIKAMIESGKSHRKIDAFWGLSGNRPVHNLLKRERQKEKRIAAGTPSRPKGRPWKNAEPKDIITEQAYEINCLKMENKLLRDFLQLTGRK